MRLHLIISRHGLPVTRILWTTSAASSGEYGARHPAPTAAVASSRTPNIAFSNGGYTVAQLLEDVNEVVPLETEPHVFDEELSGQWGLEDYVVEVAGSECLHFMEVDGLLRDGDEVVIRALQLADLRTRRLCGRHQITSEGKHLIDGVPFGSPYMKRSTTTRPAITIPPRKKRRTVFSGWEHGPGLAVEDALGEPADEEGDGEWVPPPETGFGKELSIMPPEHEESMGTVIRHPIEHLAESDSERDLSDVDEDEDENENESELESELQALKEDFEESSQFVDIRNQTRNPSGHALRATSVSKRPTSKGSTAAASIVSSSKRSRGDDFSSPRTSKAVRFNQGDQDTPEPQHANEIATEPPLSASDSAVSSDSDSDSDNSGSDSDSDSDSSDDDEEEEEEEEEEQEASSSEVEPARELTAPASESSSGSSSGSSSDSSSDSDSSDSSGSSDSESEDEVPPAPKVVQLPPVISAPGEGSTRTKKSNNRLKLRRRLSKLKELGALPEEADFDALRSWEHANGGWFNPEQSLISEVSAKPTPELSAEKSAKQLKKEKKEREQQEFEAKRQKLLRDLASGNGVDVDQTSEKENVPPPAPAAEPPVSEQISTEEKPEEESSKEAAHRRTLDVASSRRLLFGSLGMRTPKTKEEEEQTRRKLAAKASATARPKRTSRAAHEDVDQMDEGEDDNEHEGDWMNKLVIRAVECVYPDVAVTAPPYPFVQRWDKEANASIRELKGPTKKRKRKQRIQVYHNEEEEYDENGNWYGDDYYQEGDQSYYDTTADDYYQGHYGGEAQEDHQLNYDEGPEPAVSEDLPLPPSDMDTIPNLDEEDVKVGAIIVFRQLDMSKATNWQPQMSDYRVAEVRSVKEHGVINVLLAKRDRKQRPIGQDNELRQFSKFEVPDLANDEEEDDGYRELALAELSDPKLLRPGSSGGDENTQEGSIVSVVEESVPNTQPSPEMDLDETTFVTIGNEISWLESPREPANSPPGEAKQTPGGLPQIEVQTGSDQRSVTPPIPSPDFTGFHSARSWQQETPGLDANLEGRTLVSAETPSAGANRDEGPSVVSYASANQSFDDTTNDVPDEPERQVVESLVPPGESGPQSGSLLSTIDSNGVVPSSQVIKQENVKKEQRGEPRSSRESWSDMLERLRGGQSDAYELLSISDSDVDEDTSALEPLQWPSSSKKSKSPPKSPQPPKSTPNDASNPADPTHLLSFFSPAGSTRSKKSQLAREPAPGQPSGSAPKASQIPASQASQIVDLTLSTDGSPAPESSLTPSQRRRSARFDPKQESTRSQGSRASTTGSQPVVEVFSSPAQSQKKKRRTSRKF
ncbi:unnamed protein product [Penicillium olsonii]|nr:unnamed protein product [Penicillium olsonii]